MNKDKKNQREFNLIPYPNLEGVEFGFDPTHSNLWATQENICALFGADDDAVSDTIIDVFENDNLSKDEHVFKALIGNNKEIVSLYSIDVLISVGYRLNSRAATEFRRWSNDVLHQYLKDGYLLNVALLESDAEKLNELAAKIRALRSKEKTVYQAVRDCFKVAAVDYEEQKKQLGRVFALIQDKFLHAITSMHSAKLIYDRADAKENNLGLQTFDGVLPTKREVVVGKNYLFPEELYRLHLLSEQFLIFAENSALRNKQMTMSMLMNKLDDLLRFNDYPVFEGYQNALSASAKEHAEREYAHYISIKKLECLLKKEIDIDAYYLGEYDEYLEDLPSVSLPSVKKHIEATIEKKRDKVVKVLN